MNHERIVEVVVAGIALVLIVVGAQSCVERKWAQDAFVQCVEKQPVTECAAVLGAK